MKIALISINAKYIHTNNAVRLLKANSDFDIDILEYTIKDDITGIIETLNNSSYQVLGFSTYIWNVTIICSILKQLDTSQKTIILGGPEVSYEASYFMKNYPVDYIVKGEGENSFNNLLHALNNNQDVSMIDGLAFRKGGQIRQTAIKEIDNLSNISSPHYFIEDRKHIPNKITYIESSRGCPYHCSYCLSSLEEKVRFFPIDHVKQEIKYAMDNGSKTIKFLDRTFNANKSTLEVLDFIMEMDNGHTVFQFEITGDILQPKIVTYLNEHARKGLFRFEIGIQSIHYDTNYLVDRFQNTDKLFHIIKLIQDGDTIDLHLDLIAGLPLESKELFQITFDSVFSLGAKELQLGFLKLLRGTKIRKEAEKYQYIYESQAPYEIISNNVLSEADILEIKDVEHMLDLFHNKGYFKDHMLAYILEQKSPYQFFSQVASAFKREKPFGLQYQLEDIYQFIIRFINDEYETYLLLIDYLKRAKVKPKMFIKQEINKLHKEMIFEQAASFLGVSINDIYKHSVLIHHHNDYFLSYYHDLICHTYQTSI